MTLEQSPNSKPRGLYDPRNPKSPNHVPAEERKRHEAVIAEWMQRRRILDAIRERIAAQKGADVSTTHGLGVTSAALGAIVEHFDPETGEIIPDPKLDPEFTSDDIPEAPDPGESDTSLSPMERVLAMMRRDSPTYVF